MQRKKEPFLAFIKCDMCLLYVGFYRMKYFNCKMEYRNVSLFLIEELYCQNLKKLVSTTVVMEFKKLILMQKSATVRNFITIRSSRRYIESMVLILKVGVHNAINDTCFQLTQLYGMHGMDCLLLCMLDFSTNFWYRPFNLYRF